MVCLAGALVSFHVMMAGHGALLIVISLDVTMHAAGNLWLGSQQVAKKENPEAKQRCFSEGADGRFSMTQRKPVRPS